MPDHRHQVTNPDGTGVDVQKEAGGQKAFRLASDGNLRFTARCHPEQLNYVTLRLWSEDGGSRFTLKTGEGKTVTSLDHKTSGDIAPEQWYYSTRLIPRKFTNDTEQLSHQLITAKDGTSRGIYGITIHTSPRFRPGDHVPKTGTVKPRDNAGPLRGNVILARAYTLDGGKYEGDEEVLDRIAVGLDYMRRAQGANGGYVDVHSGHWVGGPERGKGEGVLEGRVHRAQANAFMLVHDDLKEAGLLDEKVDDDADPETPPVPRRKAIQDLLHNSLT